MSKAVLRPNAGGYRGPRDGPPRIPAQEVRELAMWLYGSVGHGKQMAAALGLHPVSYRSALSDDAIPRSWEPRIRALQRVRKDNVPPKVRVAIAGTFRGSQVALDKLGPTIHALADKAVADGLTPRDVAAALLAVGASRLVRSP